MGWGGGGLLTKKMEQGKRNKIVIIVDILVIITFIWFALTQRSSYDAGYQSAYNQVCGNPFGGINSDDTATSICYNIARAKAEAANMSPEKWIEIQYPKPPPCFDNNSMYSMWCT
jgi:hypothetical protein